MAMIKHNSQPTHKSLCRSVGLCTLASDGMGKPVKEIATIVAERAFPLSARGVANRIPRGAEWVLIGEASHETREFYEVRAGDRPHSNQNCLSPQSP